MPVRFGRLIILLRSTLALLTFCRLRPSVPERGALKSPESVPKP